MNNAKLNKKLLTKKEYPECDLKVWILFFTAISKGIWDRITTCPHIIHGQKKDITQLGIMFSWHANIPEDQAPLGIPPISKLDGGRSKFSSL
jgi:hypothetical protein